MLRRTIEGPLPGGGERPVEIAGTSMRGAERRPRFIVGGLDGGPA